MLLNVECEKCGERFKLDIGNRTREETIDMLSKRETFECPGNHVELSSPVNYWIFGNVEAGKAPTEAAWVKDLKKRYPEVYKNKDLTKKYEVEGFSMGACFCRNRKTGEKAIFDFGQSPKGERYYYRI